MKDAVARLSLNQEAIFVSGDGQWHTVTVPEQVRASNQFDSRARADCML